MTFKKGMTKPQGSGRKKGVKNKASYVKKVAQLLAEKNIHPIQEMLNILPELKPKDQVDVWRYLQSYIEPTLSEQRYEKLERQAENAENNLSETQTEDLVTFLKSSS